MTTKRRFSWFCAVTLSFFTCSIAPAFAQEHASPKPSASNALFTLGQSYDVTPQLGLAGVVAGDFNGDGILDLAAVNPCNVAGTSCPNNGASGSIAILLGNGDGSFQSPSLIDTGTFSPQALAVGDFNRDGHLDLALVSQCPSFDNCATGAVSIILGNGDGTFQTPGTYNSGGTGSLAIAIGDLNGDGNFDVVVANEIAAGGLGGSVTVFLGSANGTLQAGATYPSAGFLASAIALGDVNGDGALDVLVANIDGVYTSGTVAVLLGVGNGTFQPAVSYPSGGTVPGAVVVADLNHDGVLDLAIANACANGTSCPSGGSVGILLGNGDGSFQAVVPYPAGDVGTVSVVSGDFNGDGYPDLALANETLGSVTVLLGNGNGTFQSAISFSPGGSRTVALAVGDFNRDGQPDLAVANQMSADNPDTNSSLSILLNSISGFANFADSTVLTTSAAQTPIAESVRLTATVTSPVSAGVIAGNVTFYDGATSLSTVALSAGQALLNTSFATPGAHPIKAIYAGTTPYAASESAVLKESVGTPVTLASSQNPSADGASVTFTASVAGGGANGSVTFKNGANTLGTIGLSNGSAAVSTSTLPVGRQAITASYSGGGSLQAGAAILAQAIQQTTTTVVTSASEVGAANQPVTFIATVAGQTSAMPGGAVVFFEGTESLGAGVLVNGQATFPIVFSQAGTYHVSAQYLGDLADVGSTSAVFNQRVAASLPVPSTITLASSVSPSFGAQPVTFTAMVKSTYGAIPDGETVTFNDGSTAIGTGATLGGTAAFTTASLSVGTHSVTAVYAGDGTFATSTSKAVKQTVNINATDIALASSLNPSYSSEPVRLTATITAHGGVLPPNGETITFLDGSKSLGSAPMTAGVAAITTYSLAVKTHSIKATYAGDGLFAPKSSAILDQVVDTNPTSVAVQSSANPGVIGQPVKFTATIAGQTIPNGETVVFQDDAVQIGTGATSGGVATFTTDTLSTGAHTITATYTGDSSFPSSTSHVLRQTVNTYNHTVLHTFQNGADGANPHGGLVLHGTTLYGTTVAGGASGHGTAFSLALPGGAETVLHAFTGAPSDGSQPAAALIRDSSGNLYGATSVGGSGTACTTGCGTIFKISSTGAYTLLHSFDSTDGAGPSGSLTRDTAGNLFGATTLGGANKLGTVFEYSAKGTLTTLHSFAGAADGSNPFTSLLLVNGNLYGTASQGGSAASGTVFSVNAKTGATAVVYSFTGGADGAFPVGGFLTDLSGNLYGTTTGGGSAGDGAIFKLNPTTNQETVLHAFTGADGQTPSAGLVSDAQGNFYGTTAAGGAHGFGTVFKLDTSGNLFTLYSFTGGADGALPESTVALDSSGNIYGVTTRGGAANYPNGYGTAFEVSP